MEQIRFWHFYAYASSFLAYHDIVTENRSSDTLRALVELMDTPMKKYVNETNMNEI